MVPGPQLRHQGGKHGGHAGAGRLARLGALEKGEAALKHGDSGVAEARIDEARRFALEARFGLGRIFIDKARGQKHRFAGLAMRRTPRAATHHAGRPAPLFFPDLSDLTFGDVLLAQEIN